MSPEELKVQAERFFEEVLNNRNLGIMEEFLAPEYVLHDWQPPVNGPDGYRQFMENTLAVFPDIHFTLEDIVTTGNKIALRWSCEATQQGPWLGLPPSGKVVTSSGLNIQVVNAEGNCVEEWMYFDALDVLIQLGGFQLPTTAPATAP